MNTDFRRIYEKRYQGYLKLCKESEHYENKKYY